MYPGITVCFLCGKQKFVKFCIKTAKKVKHDNSANTSQQYVDGIHALKGQKCVLFHGSL